MGKKKKKKQPVVHPTLFVLDGALRNYPDGSMLELSMQITAEEFDQIMRETIQYKIFVDCLKEVAFPILNERWTEEDEWYQLMLGVNLGRIKNIDPMKFILIDQKEIRASFEAKIRENAQAVSADIEKFRQSQSDTSRTEISDL